MQMNFKKLSLLGVVLFLAVTAFAQGRGSAEVTIKGKKVSIDYGKPPLGSHSVSQLPNGGVWRLGMNEATRLTTDGELSMGGATVAAGTYTLWVKRVDANTFTLAVHPKIQGANGKNLWGFPSLTTGFVAELPLKKETAKDSADPLAISLAENKGKAWIKIQWGTDVLSGAFDVK